MQSPLGLLALLVLLSAAIGLAQTTQPLLDETFESPEHAFRLKYPSMLTPSPTAAKRSIVMLASAKNGPDDVFQENVHVKIEAGPLKNVSLQAAAAGFRGSMEKNGVKVIEAGDAKLGGRDAKFILYTHPIKTNAGELSIKGIVTFLMKNDHVIGVDIRATTNEFDGFRPIGQAVLDSLEWTD